MIFFTSDTHYYHTNVIEYCNRPFKTVEEMNETLINNYNSVVGEKDTVYHLGDFAFANRAKAEEILNRLNGKKILILGNHDFDPRYNGEKFYKEIFHEVYYYHELKYNGTRFCLFHFPIESWNKRHRGSIHLHGHTHSTYDKRNEQVPNRFDVGVDTWDFKPVSIEEILKLKTETVVNDRYHKKDNEI